MSTRTRTRAARSGSPEPTRLGEGGPLFRYEPKGGRCSRPRCKREAPLLVVAGRTVKLPCLPHGEEEERAREEEDRLARIEACIIHSGRTRRMREWSFETYRRACTDANAPKMLALAEAWVANYLATREIVGYDEDGEPVRRGGHVPNLMMWGSVGCGKTGLAWSMVRAICEEGYPAKIVNFKHLLDAMKDCYSRKIPTTQAAEAGSYPVLVLDDVGAERPTEWACGELLGIVDWRYERGLPTVYVSNYPPGELAVRLGRDDPVIGERIVSRMQEGSTKMIFEGGDRRLAA